MKKGCIPITAGLFTRIRVRIQDQNTVAKSVFAWILILVEVHCRPGHDPNPD
jgi:hypothetical protein